MRLYKVTYVCNTMFMRWTAVVEARDEDEAAELVSTKGKILQVVEHTEG